MKAKRKTNTLAIVIFVGFVAVTGFMFVQAGYFENPFGFVQAYCQGFSRRFPGEAARRFRLSL